MSAITHHQIKFSKTAHYYTLGALSEQTEYIWLICHGYGQAADTFIQKFNSLDLNKHFVIAPEGLSRFYWGGFTGDVVSSWMTRKDRLDEISDYISYLSTVADQFSQRSFGGAQWIALGFSQGVSTIMRYLATQQPVVAQILLWAGVFPPEIDYKSFKTYLNRTGVHYFYGDKDELIEEDRLNQNLMRIKQCGVSLSIHNFEGKHTVDRKTLEAFVQANM